MQKRGQVSIFVIVGIVLLILVILGFVLFQDKIRLPSLGGDVQSQLNSKLVVIEKKVDDCTNQETVKLLNEIGDNGGVFNAVNFVTYEGKRYNILCSNIKKSDKCLSNPIVYNSIAEKLENELPGRIKVCVNLNNYRSSDINVNANDPKVDSTINQDNVEVDVDYQITVSKEGRTEKSKEFKEVVKVPMGKIIDTVNDILNSESEGISFDPLAYGLKYMSQRIVTVHQPYPDRVFTVAIRDYDYVFRFGIEGESRFE